MAIFNLDDDFGFDQLRIGDKIYVIGKMPEKALVSIKKMIIEIIEDKNLIHSRSRVMKQVLGYFNDDVKLDDVTEDEVKEFIAIIMPYLGE